MENHVYIKLGTQYLFTYFFDIFNWEIGIVSLILVGNFFWFNFFKAKWQ